MKSFKSLALALAVTCGMTGMAHAQPFGFQNPGSQNQGFQTQGFQTQGGQNQNFQWPGFNQGLTVTLANYSNETVTVYSGYGNQMMPQGTLAPGEVRPQPTAVGQYWRISGTHVGAGGTVVQSGQTIQVGQPMNQPQFNQPQFNQPQFNQPQFNQPQTASLPLNQAVLNFANSRMGQTVGRGECWDLAKEALQSAGAKVPGMDMEVYVFGRRLSGPQELQPGDIIQMQNAQFTTAWGSSSAWQHTVIVTAVNGSRIDVLEQNFNNIRSVTRGNYDISTLTGGTLTYYRPEARSGRTNNQFVGNGGNGFNGGIGGNGFNGPRLNNGGLGFNLGGFNFWID